MEDLTLAAVIAVALFFDFTNGFHDTANAIATSVSTRALTPRTAVLIAAKASSASDVQGCAGILPNPCD